MLIRNRAEKGFTLLEILIALFIFTILSMMLTAALHNVINIQASTESHAERLRKLQFALLIFSRDIEQAIDRPILNSGGKEEKAFIGSSRNLTFTHTGVSNSTIAFASSALQRVSYDFDKETWWRYTWPVLDQAVQTKSHRRVLLTDVTDARFEYIDNEGRPHAAWPLEGNSKQALPSAVRIYLTLSKWGTMSQLYVIPAEPANAVTTTPAS